MKWIDRLSAAALAMGMLCAAAVPGVVGATPADAGLHLRPSPFGVVCAGESAIDGRVWTCDDVERVAAAYAADSAALSGDIPPVVRDVVIALVASRQPAGGAL